MRGSRRSDRQIRDKLGAGIFNPISEEALQKTLQKSRQALYENEAADRLSDAEFLFQQGRYIRRRWWALQAGVLIVLWFLLEWAESSYYIRRYMGVGASLFGILVLPELWKNRSVGAMEIEGAAYYSLRQVYAARIFLFALVDFALLCGFSAAAVLSGSIGLEQMLVQFMLPYVVTCCICFRTLYSTRIDSEAFALFLCVLWSLVWLLIALDEKIYSVVSLPVWLAMLATAALYLGHCIRQGQRTCGKLMEVKPLWN